VWGYPRKRRGGGLDFAVGKGVVLRDRVLEGWCWMDGAIEVS